MVINALKTREKITVAIAGIMYINIRQHSHMPVVEFKFIFLGTSFYFLCGFYYVALYFVLYVIEFVAIF